uniref:Uncharacterized protein n=1 Tax=Manihot esculenta TaxID=3983 RepID=A0A2C9VPG0_MANES
MLPGNVAETYCADEVLHIHQFLHLYKRFIVKHNFNIWKHDVRQCFRLRIQVAIASNNMGINRINGRI